MPTINQITDTVPLQKSGGTGLDIFSAGLADGAGRIVDSGGSPVWSWDENGVIAAKGLPRVVHVNVTPDTNGGSGVEDMMSFSLPAGLLANDGDAVRIATRSTVYPTTNVKLQFWAGSNGLNISDSIQFSTETIVQIDVLLVRTSATTCLPLVFVHANQTDDALAMNAFACETEEISVAWANAVAVKLTAETAAASQCTQSFMQVVYEPAPV